ncbi:MAG: coproporphyrinogen III oxidase [Actinobacteria bacterium]|nr:coproporphyrinogen III oxidase [Actinomycetota bacterium]NBO47152.1 coproporphyrinogen III oxidase [Actinomycetota bacterium]NCY10713.1 coproporphyrinogen III oxidase [Actinomycetota bacterium]NDA35955.1 coproporphyrinogen III oxidase [Actinomycetota bacterium]NDA57345.1 coproporphyrinogen III oxidase [Actinomycetota bacterium]
MSQRLSFYIHIPYCAKRCGYCDFNTYTPSELKSGDLDSLSDPYIDSALKEIEMAAKEVGSAIVPTIFFGGGTPSLLPAAQLARIIDEIRRRFTLEKDIEITIEVNPDSVSKEFLDEIKSAGATRVSMGMQSAVISVLKVLDRTHNPESVGDAVAMARTAGFKHVSVDLIYGSPGETIDDWRRSLEYALALDIDHISAYALIVEKGTKLAAQISRGELTMPPDDQSADKYLLADQLFEAAGFSWYELSNWSKPGGQCRHNIAYWDGSYWWGVGAGAHSYLSGKRWWNVKHPSSYQEKISHGQSPELSHEILTPENLSDEFIMLQIRRREGILHNRLNPSQIHRAEEFLSSGFLDFESWQDMRLVLSRSGRLIADKIVRELVL